MDRRAIWCRSIMFTEISQIIKTTCKCQLSRGLGIKTATRPLSRPYNIWETSSSSITMLLGELSIICRRSDWAAQVEASTGGLRLLPTSTIKSSQKARARWATTKQIDMLRAMSVKGLLSETELVPPQCWPPRTITKTSSCPLKADKRRARKLRCWKL